MRPATKGYNNFMRQAPEETECFHLIQLLFFNRPSIMSDSYFSVVCLALLCKAGRPHIKFIRGPGLMREQDLPVYQKNFKKCCLEDQKNVKPLCRRTYVVPLIVNLKMLRY